MGAEEPDLDALFGAEDQGAKGPGLDALFGAEEPAAGKPGDAIQEGPDLDALFGDGPRETAVTAATGQCQDKASAELVPHPALLRSVETLAEKAWQQVASELRVAQGAEPGANVPVASAPGLANRMDKALEALRRSDWEACRVEADAVRASVWESFLAAKSWQRICDREVFMLAELLVGLCASSSDPSRAMLAADRVYVFAGKGGFRDAALLFARWLDAPAREQRRAAGAARLDVDFPAHSAGAALPALPAGSQQVRRVRIPDTPLDEVVALLGGGAGGDAPAPVVVEGALEAWPAREKWRSLAHLEAVAGHRVVPVEIGTVGAGMTEELMTVDDFLQRYLSVSCQCFAQGEDLPKDGVAYLAQHELLDQCPDLRADVRAPEAWTKALGQPTRCNVWLGTHGTVTPCHWDSYHNCLAQVQGMKRALLLPHSANRFLYVDDGKGGGEASQGNLSRVDIERPDFERFPAYREAPPVIVADLKPGDALFIPEGWWHQVRALSPSFSVNFWF